jgi:hypothetical protein
MPIHPKKPRKNIPNLHPEGFSPADPHLWAQAGNGLDQLQASSLALYGLTWTSMKQLGTFWGNRGNSVQAGTGSNMFEPLNFSEP